MNNINAINQYFFVFPLVNLLTYFQMDNKTIIIAVKSKKLINGNPP